MQRYFDKTLDSAPAGAVSRAEIYQRLRFPRGAEHPSRRPYTAINMVCTVDGKIAIGGPGTTRLIGGPTDHFLMARIEFQADAVLLGATLIREDDPGYPQMNDQRRREREALGLRADPLWAVVSSRGDFPRLPRVFQSGRERTALFTSHRITPARRAELEEWTRVFICGEARVEPLAMGRVLRDELGVSNMICLGGATLNASLLDAGAADELFLTLAPKLHGGSERPTLAEGAGYAPDRLPVLELLSLYGDESELYLRYRLPPERPR